MLLALTNYPREKNLTGYNNKEYLRDKIRSLYRIRSNKDIAITSYGKDITESQYSHKNESRYGNE